MIDIETIQNRMVEGFLAHMQQYGITKVVERDQDAPKPQYPFIGFKWTSIVPEGGGPRRTKRPVPSSDPDWEHDVEYHYVRNPEPILSVTIYDGDGSRIHGLTQAAHTWWSIGELAGDWLRPVNAVVAEAMAIHDRDTVLDREIERRQGFDVRLRVLDEVRVTVPTIERVEVTGPDGDTQEVDL